MRRLARLVASKSHEGGLAAPKPGEGGSRITEHETRPTLHRFNAPTLHAPTIMLMQLPNVQPGQLENWLLPAVAVLSIAALIKKVFPRKRSDDELVSKTELHHELNTVRDKIDARFLTLSEKIEHLGTSLHEKLTALESAIARLDERTKS